MKRSLLLLLMVAVAMVVTTACGGSKPASGSPIKIGVIQDTSGAASYYSQESVKGIKLAVEQINAKGGVGGRPLELVLEDDQNKPPVSAEKFRKLAGDKDIVVVLTVSGSADALQSQTIAEEEKLPEIAPTNVNDKLTATPLKYFYRISPGDSMFFEQLIGSVAKYKKIAIIGDNTQTGLATTNSYVDALKKKNVNVVAVEQVDTGATDASPQVLRMKEKGADVVLLTAQGGPELALATRTVRQMNWQVPIFGTSTVGVPAFVQLAKEAADGVIFTDIIDDDKKSFQDLNKAWDAKYQNPISTNAVLSYDSIYLLAEVMKKGVSRAAIRDGLEQVSKYTAVSGAQGATVTFQAGNHQGMGPEAVTLRTYKGGKQIKYKS